MISKRKQTKIIHRISVILTIVMFLLSYGTLGALEQGHIDFMSALHRLIIFVVLILFFSSAAYLTREEDKH